MSSETVIDLAAKRMERDPHRAGMANCLNCRHKWAAVAPIGTTQLVCPSCKTDQGLFVGLACTEFPQWQCACGEYVFFIDAHGPYCCHCGIRPEIK